MKSLIICLIVSNVTIVLAVALIIFLAILYVKAVKMANVWEGKAKRLAQRAANPVKVVKRIKVARGKDNGKMNRHPCFDCPSHGIDKQCACALTEEIECAVIKETSDEAVHSESGNV